jgi:glycosyltransferase involved in cell wall biosynthesis
VAARANHLLTISSASALDIHRVLGVEYERMTVVHHGVDPEYLAGRTATDDEEMAQLRTLGVVKPYVFGLGAIDPRKNTTRLVEAFSLVSRDAVGNTQLVIAGLTPAALDAFRELSTRLGISSRVVLLGFVSEAHLRLLYRRARVFCYPSLYEGFGLPLIEAMASGTAVVSSAIDAVREVAGDAAILINPFDSESIAGGLESVLDQEELRRDIIRRGSANAQRFSWARAVEAVLSVYRRVAARPAVA